MNDFYDEKDGVKIMSAKDLEIIELARNIKDWPQVLSTSMRKGKVTDITMGIELKIDKGNFSRIMAGQGNFPIEKLPLFCEVARNDLPVHWIGYQCGYELRLLPKTLEYQLEKERYEKEEALKRIAILEDLLLKKDINNK